MTGSVNGFRRWALLAVVSLGLLLITVDMTVLYTALPALTAELGADASQKLWILNAYPLVMAGLLPGCGALGDRFGHTRMFLGGAAVFGLASALAAFAPGPEALVGARALLAVGAAAMLPATLALVRITFTDERERNIAIGIWGAMSVCGTALGPIVGGLLLELYWWGSVFLVNVPVVVVALVAGAVLAPAARGRSGHPWDALSSLLATVGLAAVVYTVKELATGTAGVDAAAAAVLGAAALVAFVRRQRRPRPLLDLDLVRRPMILLGVLGAAAAMFATAGTQLVLSQRLQLLLGLTPLQAGLIVVAFAAGCLPAGIIAGGLIHRTGAAPLVVGGLFVGAAGAVSTWLLTPGSGSPLPMTSDHPAWVVPGLVLLGTGLGVTMTAASTAVISTAPADRAGMAASVEEVSYELGGLFGVAVLGSTLTGLYTSAIVLPAGAPATAADGVDAARAAAADLPPDEAGPLVVAMRSAFDTGYTVALLLTAVVLALGGAVAARLARRARARGVGDGAPPAAGPPPQPPRRTTPSRTAQVRITTDEGTTST